MKWPTHQTMALMASFTMGFPLAGMAAAWAGSVIPDVLDQRAASRAFFRQKNSIKFIVALHTGSAGGWLYGYGLLQGSLVPCQTLSSEGWASAR